MKSIIKEYLPQILGEVERRVIVLKEVADWETLSTKLKSELISNIIETTFSSIVPNTYDPKKDSEPDLYVNGEALEIKTAKTTYMWRGGEYSKRNGNFLLIGWNEIEGELRWFVLFTYLNESDWKSSTSSNYYATTIDLNDVLKISQTDILWGNTVKKKIKEHINFN